MGNLGGNRTEAMVVSTLRNLHREYSHNGKQPIGYFNFVIDPDCFSTTIENMFYVSFLVKEGQARIVIDEATSLPTIAPVRRRGALTEENHHVRNQVGGEFHLLKAK